MEFNLADLFEAVVETVPGAPALVCAHGGETELAWSYAELDDRVNRMANVLVDQGVHAGDHVGLHLYNGWEYVVAMLALYKLRAVPVNVNYRYVTDELAYLFADADLVGVLTEPELASLVAEARDSLSGPAFVLTRGNELDAELDAADATRPDVGPRSADDLYLLYTGGTTGKPKGVMWRHEDIYFASLGGRGTPSKGIPAMRRPEDIYERVRRGDPITRRLPLCPLMHGGAMWIALQSHLSGGCLILATDRHFDPVSSLTLMAKERVDLVMLIGDATARPIADELGAHPDRHDLSALQVIASGGAILSPAVKQAFRELLPAVKVVDTFGASETGGQGRLASSDSAESSGAPRLITDADTAVFDENLQPIPPGSGRIGRLARTGHIPLGYYKDDAKTAETFPVIEGRRWSMPGDLARVEDDGTITLLGRGAMCINTGGEKVFPEEVEGVVKSHPAVFDAMVVGVPDERFGQRVVAVVSLRAGAGDPNDDELRAHVRQHLAGYKVPRSWIRVSECRRLPTGKPDYQWARAVAAEAAELTDHPG